MDVYHEMILHEYAMKHVGLPYRYGGANPMIGYDCSGLVLELLQAVGLWKHGVDASADAIMQHFKTAGKPMPLDSTEVRVGTLCFFGANGQASHIGMALDEVLMIEAGGGDHTTTDLAAAIKRGAYVRIRPIRTRKDLIALIDPACSRTPSGPREF